MRTLLILVLFPFIVLAQQSVGLHQAFLDLKHDGVLMNLSAHPDDEDGASLALYRMKYGVKTYSVFFTRGEGGQNETGPELYEELGVLRTAETEAAARIQGTEAHFLNFKDFGYSKTATETFRRWGGKTEVLRRLVYTIRKLKPDILFTNHNSIDGHGHHQAVAITALEAFDAAADSAYFPEQLREPGVTLWQPRKLFFRLFSRNEQAPDVSNNVQEFDSVRGASYFDVAVTALQMHKTQGLDKADLRRFTRGLSMWKLIRSNSQYGRDTTDFFSGVRLLQDSRVAVVRTRQAVSSLLESGNQEMLLASIDSIQGSIIRSLDTEMPSPLERRLLLQWNERLGDLAAALCGIKVNCMLEDSMLVPGQKVNMKLQAVSSEHNVSNVRFVLDGSLTDWKLIGQPTDVKLSRNRYEETRALSVGNQPHLTIPKTTGNYNPLEWKSTFSVEAHIQLSSGAAIRMYSRVRYDIAPPHVLSVKPSVVRMATEERAFSYTVENHFPHKSAGRIHIVAPPGWLTNSAEFVIPSEDLSATGSISVHPPVNVMPGSYVLHFSSEFASDSAVVRVFDVHVPSGISIGIIKSYDNTLEMACSELGVQYKLLDEKDLEGANLQSWASIVVDIRSYLVREDLKQFNMRLLEYVKNGGNLRNGSPSLRRIRSR